MAYRVTQHNQELIIEKDYRYSAFMPGVFGVFLLFFALLTEAQANMPGAAGPSLLHWLSMLFALGGVFFMLAGAFFYFKIGRVVIDFDNDAVKVYPLFRRPRHIAFKEIDGLTIRKTSVPASRHMEETMGVDQVNHWELMLRTDQGIVALIDLYSELEVKRFLLEMQRGADWPVEHVNIPPDRENDED